MKKILYILCAMVAFASCSKEELTSTGGQNPDGSYTFNLGIEEPDYVPKTRTTVPMGRYVMEMYEGDLTATPVKMTNADGVFKVEMKKNTEYVCLFWADNGTDYDATSLKAVKQTDETKLGTAAYFAKVELNTKTFNGTVTLKRAVAELSFVDKNGLTEATNSLKITYPYASATLNVGDGTVTHATGSAVRTISGITPPSAATTFATDFVLAPTVAVKIAGLKFQLNAEEEKTIAETAIQANYKTKITGEYYKPKLKIGDFYMKDGTWLPSTTTLTEEQKANCIGIVFAVNADGKTGKIVGLTEEERDKIWSTETITTNATSDDDGADNTDKIFGLDSYKANPDTYPAFELVVTQNATAPTGIKWYLPATHELKNGIWDNKATLNTSLGKIASAAQLSDDCYWSSTECNSDFAWFVCFDYGNMLSYHKDRTRSSVRVVSAF